MRLPVRDESFQITTSRAISSFCILFDLGGRIPELRSSRLDAITAVEFAVPMCSGDHGRRCRRWCNRPFDLQADGRNAPRKALSTGMNQATPKMARSGSWQTSFRVRDRWIKLFEWISHCLYKQGHLGKFTSKITHRYWKTPLARIRATALLVCRVSISTQEEESACSTLQCWSDATFMAWVWGPFVTLRHIDGYMS